VLNAGGFAVKDLARLADIAAVGFDNGLVAEADADDRQLARMRVSNSGMQPASLGVPGPGESISTGLSMVPRRSISACAGTELR
jgi:hypothetical protein